MEIPEMHRKAKRAAIVAMVAAACMAMRAEPPSVIVVEELVPRPGVLAGGDLVAVTVHGILSADKDEVFERHVGEDGRVGLPWVGPLAMKGFTTDRAAGLVVSELRRANVMNNAIVTMGILRSGADSHIHPGGIAQGAPLRITIYELVGQGTRTDVLAVVAGDGTVELPAAGEVKLEGLSEAEADLAVRNRLREKGVMEDAVVAVLRLEPNGKK